VWRMLRRSNALRARTAELRRRKAAEIGARLIGLGEMAVDQIHQAIADGDRRVVCWLADRLRLFDVPFAEDIAAVDSQGAEQLEGEEIAQIDPVPAEIEAARTGIATVEAEVAAAESSVQVTSLADQGDKQATVSRGNALSALRYAVTKSRVYPPSGVFADD